MRLLRIAASAFGSVAVGLFAWVAVMAVTGGFDWHCVEMTVGASFLAGFSIFALAMTRNVR